MRILDLSTDGCRIGLINETLEVGRVVTLKMPLDEDIDAQVIWAQDQAVGLKFNRPLHLAIVRFLGFDDCERSDDRLKDSFGRALRSRS